MRYIFGSEEDISDTGFVEVEPSSRSTADVSPIDVTCTELTRLRLIPKLVNNSRDSLESVSAKLVFEKRKKKDESFPSEAEGGAKTSRQNIRRGDWLELSLSTRDVYALGECIAKLYDLYAAAGIPRTYTRFIEADASTARAISTLKGNPAALQMLFQEENYDIVRDVLQLIAQNQSRDSLRSMLSELKEDSIQRLSATLNTEQLERAATEFEQNIDNPNEEFWQNTLFGNYPWILSQVFAAPVMIFARKAYVGGKGIDNKNGNECDFIYQNHLTKNVCLIEIKTPKKKLLGSEYRGTYSLSSELSGGINQVLNYRDSLMKTYHSLEKRDGAEFEVFSPHCAVIIGNTNELDSERKRSAFENFRNSMTGVAIITFDELLEKIKSFVRVMQ